MLWLDCMGSQQGESVVPQYHDMYQVSENQRIPSIGEAAETALIAVLLETDQPEKIARYIRKITRRYAKVQHIDTTPGLCGQVSVVRFGPRTRH